jgi:hypothetical protein
LKLVFLTDPLVLNSNPINIFANNLANFIEILVWS